LIEVAEHKFVLRKPIVSAGRKTVSGENFSRRLLMVVDEVAVGHIDNLLLVVTPVLWWYDSLISDQILHEI
jgi:hypothetical protein